MHNIDLPWHQFSVNLASVEAWVKANTTDYVGNSSDTDLTLHFTTEPNDAAKAAVRAYWEALTAESPEAVAYTPQATISAAIEAARLDAIAKPWDALSIAQRKLVLGLTPSMAELFPGA
jgi:hypothetical protein